jgi:hypothetical protein
LLLLFLLSLTGPLARQKKKKKTDERSTAGEELLNAFKVANFSTKVTDDMNDPDFWTKVIPKSEIEKAEQKVSSLSSSLFYYYYYYYSSSHSLFS